MNNTISLNLNTKQSPQYKKEPLKSYPSIDLAGQLYDEQTKLELGSGSIDKSVAVVWIPTKQVWLTEVLVPGKRKSDWMKALPFALEEKLSQPVEELFFAVLHRENKGDNAGRTFVAVVSNKQMSAWIEVLQSYGLAATQLIPDCFQIPFLETEESNEDLAQWLCLEKETELLVRAGRYSGFCGSSEWVNNLVALAKKEQSDLEMAVIDKLDNNVQLSLKDIKQLGLRQGVFKPASQQSGLRKTLLTPIILTLLILVVFVFSLVMDTKYLERQAMLYQNQTEALFKTMFPDVQRIVNIKAQTRTALAGASSAEDEVFIGLAEMTAKIDVTFQKNLQVNVEKMQWHQGQLVLNLNATDSKHLQQLDKQMPASLNAQLNIKQVQKEQVSAEITIMVIGERNVR